MTHHRALNVALTAAVVVTLATILLSGPMLDDHSADHAASTALLDAQRAARSEQRKERAAAQLCIKLQGPGTGYRWTDQGDLVCHDHRTGRNSVVVASKGGAL